MIIGFIALLLFQILGEIIVAWFGLLIPGPVMGAILLLVFLMLRGRVPNSLRLASDQLLALLPLALVPISVGILVYTDLFKAELMAISVAVIVSTLIALLLTGFIMQRLQK